MLLSLCQTYLILSIYSIDKWSWILKGQICFFTLLLLYIVLAKSFHNLKPRYHEQKSLIIWIPFVPCNSVEVHMCICKYVDVVCVRMCADTCHKHLCQHASGRTGHQASSFTLSILVLSQVLSLSWELAIWLDWQLPELCLSLPTHPTQLYSEGLSTPHGHAHHTVLTLACHITNWAIYPDQTPKIPNQDE